MLNVKGQWKKGERVLPQLPVVLCHVEEEGLFVAQMKVIFQAIVYSELPVMISPIRWLRRLDRFQKVDEFILTPRCPNEVALIEVLPILAYLPPPPLLQDRSDKRIIIAFSNIEFAWTKMLLRVDPIERYPVFLVDDLI